MHILLQELTLPLFLGLASNQNSRPLKMLLVLTLNDEVCEDLVLQLGTSRLGRFLTRRKVDRHSIPCHGPTNGQEPSFTRIRLQRHSGHWIDGDHDIPNLWCKNKIIIIMSTSNELTNTSTHQPIF
jgi:hypothetical protein